MAGRRRIQRSVRVRAAAALLGCAALLVAGGLLAGGFPALSLAAVLGLLAGAAAAGLVYGELLESRRRSAREAAEQAAAFQQTTLALQRERTAFGEQMAGRVRERDLAIGQLATALRAAQQEAAGARSSAAAAAARAGRESRRADEAQRQLARLLDEVFGTALVDADPAREIELLRSRRAS